MSWQSQHRWFLWVEGARDCAHPRGLAGPVFLQGRDDIRLTIDTPEDLVNALKVYSDLKAKDENFTLQDVVTYLDAHEDIKQSMISNIFQNKK